MKPNSTDLIHRLLNPRRIAVVGASDKQGKVGGIIFKRLLESRAEIIPVNPFEDSVTEVPTVGSIDALPPEVDLAVITLGAEKSVTAAEECAAHGIPFLIVIAGGFSEAGKEGERFEERLARIRSRSQSRILGPNTLGVFVPEHRLDTIFVEHGDRALAGGGGVAFITQSGSIGVESLGLASNTGFGMRAFVGLGNKVDLDEMDFLEFFGDDEKTDCLAFYIETFEKGRTFLEHALRITLEKPIVILKAGRTEAGASAVSSHTGRLAGSDKVVSGAFRQYGIQRAFDDEELCDAAKTVSALPPAPGNRVAVVTPAGGFGVMCTDYIESESFRAPLAMAELQPRTVSRIREHALEIASLKNPVDLTASADNRMFLETVQALIDDEGVDIVICITFFAPPTIDDMLIDRLGAVITRSPKPVLVFTEYGPFTEDYLRRFYRLGVIGFSSMSRVVRAARFLVERGEILRYFRDGRKDGSDENDGSNR